MLKKFVLITGALDIPIGLAAYASAFMNPQPGQFLSLIVLGTFLLMSAALLMWGSANMAQRAPVIFWQGLVRLSLVAAVIYAVPNNLATYHQYYVAAFDGTIGLTYVLGMMKVTGHSFGQLITCKSAD